MTRIFVPQTGRESENSLLVLRVNAVALRNPIASPAPCSFGSCSAGTQWATFKGDAMTINRTHSHATTPQREIQFGFDLRRITCCMCLALIVVFALFSTISRAQ